MPNLRIVSTNLADSGTTTTSSQASVSMSKDKLRTKAKSEFWRSAAGTTAKISHTFASPSLVGLLALPNCNLSPTAQGRWRISTETSTTNYLSYSTQIAHVNWVLTAMATSEAAAAMAPDGTTTAAKLIPTSAALTEHFTDRGVGSLADNARYSASVYLKAAEIPRAVISFIGKSGLTNALEINLEDGRVTRYADGGSQGGLTTCNAVDAGNGWWRVMLNNVGILTGATTPKLRIRPAGHARAGSGLTLSNLNTPTIDVQASPVPGYVVERITENTAATIGHYVNATVFAEAGRTLVIEAHIKALGAGATRYVSFVFVTGTGMSIQQTLNINPATGDITSQGANVLTRNLTVTDAGNGWWAVRCEVTPNTTGSFSWQIRLNNISTSSISTYTGDGASGFFLCKPYVSTLIPDNTWAPVNYDGRLAALGNGTSDGIYAWGAQVELGPTTTSFYPTPAGSATTRPTGYMDNWQAYNFDSGWVNICPGVATVPDGWTAVAAASAYAYGGGMCARVWAETQQLATAMTFDISDPANLQGYIEASRLVCGPYWEAATNPDYGASAEVVDRSKSEYNDAGDLITDLGTRSTKLTLELSKLSPSDRAKAWQLLRASGTSRPLFASLYPNSADGQLEQMHQIYGQLVSTPSMKTPLFNLATATLDIQGV